MCLPLPRTAILPAMAAEAAAVPIQRVTDAFHHRVLQLPPSAVVRFSGFLLLPPYLPAWQCRTCCSEQRQQMQSHCSHAYACHAATYVSGRAAMLNRDPTNDGMKRSPSTSTSRAFAR